jgi:hypothetical protein
MKYVLPILAIVALFAGQAVAADGNVSSDILAKMGLSNMQVMSDAQGTSVRGMGFSAVAGSSTARLFGSSATNSYVAVDTGKKTLAAGASVSGVVVGVNSVVGPWVVAGGGSIAVTR